MWPRNTVGIRDIAKCPDVTVAEVALATFRRSALSSLMSGNWGNTMRRVAKILLEKSIDSIVLAVEHFNRPWDRGRSEAVMIFLDRGLELFVKAAIVHRGGRIRETGVSHTIGLKPAVGLGLSQANIQFLSQDQARTLLLIHAERGAAQHYMAGISERELYVFAQSGVTIISDLLQTVFARCLADELPERVLPISVKPPTSMEVLMADEVAAVHALLAPRSRHGVEAEAKIRVLSILEHAVVEDDEQPMPSEIERVKQQIRKGKAWDEIFPGVASLTLNTEGDGFPFHIRITKNQGMPVRLVAADDPVANAIGIRKVNDLDFYSLGLRQLAQHVDLSEPRTWAVIQKLKLQQDPECYKEFRIGKSRFKQYSAKVIEKIKAAQRTMDMQAIWRECRPRPRGAA